jgi:sugar/nucleoside kinase (ribokinase family)
MIQFRLVSGGHSPYRRIVGVGGIGSGIFLALEGNHDLGRNESRPARLINARDYCKLHIIMHYLAVLLDADGSESSFHVLPIGKVGSDDEGVRLLEEMTDAGLDIHYVESAAARSTLFSVCYQYPDGTGGNITTSESAASLLTTSDIDHVIPLFEEGMNRSIALAVPEVPLHVRHHLLKLATTYEAFRVASFTSAEILEAQRLGLFSLVDLVALNEDEAGNLLGRRFDPYDPWLFLGKCAAVLTASQPQINIIISAAKEGAFGFSEGEWIHSPSLPVNIVSTAGAGDALLAGTLAAMIAGLPFTNSAAKHDAKRQIRSALDFGVLLASYSATSPHTIHPQAQLNDLRGFADALGLTFDEDLSKSLVARN